MYLRFASPSNSFLQELHLSDSPVETPSVAPHSPQERKKSTFFTTAYESGSWPSSCPFTPHTGQLAFAKAPQLIHIPSARIMPSPLFLKTLLPIQWALLPPTSLHSSRLNPCPLCRSPYNHPQTLMGILHVPCCIGRVFWARLPHKMSELTTVMIVTIEIATPKWLTCQISSKVLYVNGFV